VDAYQKNVVKMDITEIHMTGVQYIYIYIYIYIYTQFNIYTQWGDLGVDGWIILGRISRKWDVGIWTGLGWPRIETGGGRL